MPIAMLQTFTVTPDSAGQRLDLFCATQLPALSRSAIQKAIKDGNITINDKPTKPKNLVKDTDVVRIALPDADPNQKTEPTAPAPKLSIPIIYEDEDFVVVNKPAGVTVYDTTGQPTVATWFANRYAKLGQIGPDPVRSGIVHRLDKDTSGVLILAKSEKGLEHASAQFKRGHVRKQYLALVFGVPGMSKGRINQPLSRSKRNPMRRMIDPEGREAVTEWKAEQKLGEDYTFMRLYPLTGRMHQLRAHMHFYNHPIVGDTLYSFKRQRPPKGVARQLLHAEKITFKLTDGESVTVTAPLAKDFQEVLEAIRNELHRKNNAASRR